MKLFDFTIDENKKRFTAYCGHCGKGFRNAKAVLDHILEIKGNDENSSDPKTSGRKRSSRSY